MISREEVIELATPRSYSPVDSIDDFAFTEMDLLRFAQACYRNGVEDAAWVCDELEDNEVVSKHVSSGHCLVTRSGMYRCAESIRALLDHSVDSSNMEDAR